MFPTLFKLGSITIHTYGLMLAIGFFVALQYILVKSEQRNFPQSRIFDLVLYTSIAGLIGARLTYIATNWGFYSGRVLDVFKIWEGGMVFYGGFIAGIITAALYLKAHRELPFWKVSDVLAPAIALGHFFGRIGCLSAGCCYGKPCDLPWAVTFTASESLGPLNIALHPTQAYEAFGNLSIFFILVALDMRNRISGKIFGMYLVFYAILRFIVEFLRGDDRGAYLLGFSQSQIFSLIIFVVGIIILGVKVYGKKTDR